MTKNTKTQNTFPAWLVLAVLIPSFISSKAFTDPFILPKIYSFYFLAGAVLIIFCYLFFNKKYNTIFRINWLDIAVFAFVLYQLIRAIYPITFNGT